MSRREEVKGLHDTLLAYNEAWAEGAVSDGVYGAHLETITKSLDKVLMELDDELLDIEPLIFAEIKEEEVKDEELEHG